MFYMKSNFKYASPVAGKKDIDLLHTVGLVGINKLENSTAIMQRLVNSNIIEEGCY